MHVILCVERLVLEGATESALSVLVLCAAVPQGRYIRENSVQLLMTYATSDSMFLQLVAAKVLERLSESKSEKVRSTAKDRAGKCHVNLQVAN